MPATRVSYTIDPAILGRFNEVFPASTRSATVQLLMEKAISAEFANLSAIAREAETHADFAQARADAKAWDAASNDGLGTELDANFFTDQPAPRKTKK